MEYFSQDLTFTADGQQIEVEYQVMKDGLYVVVASCNTAALITLGMSDRPHFHPTKSHGGADVVSTMIVGADEGTTLYVSVRSLDGATGYIDIIGLEEGYQGASMAPYHIQTPEEVKPEIETITATSPGAGAFSATFRPETIYQVWDLHTIICSQNVGAGNLTVRLTDGTNTWHEEVYAMAGAGIQEIDLESEFLIYSHPFPVTRDLYFTATFTATGAAENIVIRGYVHDRMVS